MSDVPIPRADTGSTPVSSTFSLFGFLCVLENDENLRLEDELELKVRPRDSETIALQMPKETLGSFKKVANQRDMSSDALLKF